MAWATARVAGTTNTRGATRASGTRPARRHPSPSARIVTAWAATTPPRPTYPTASTLCTASAAAPRPAVVAASGWRTTRASSDGRLSESAACADRASFEATPSPERHSVPAWSRATSASPFAHRACWRRHAATVGGRSAGTETSASRERQPRARARTVRSRSSASVSPRHPPASSMAATRHKPAVPLNRTGSPARSRPVCSTAKWRSSTAASACPRAESGAWLQRAWTNARPGSARSGAARWRSVPGAGRKSTSKTAASVASVWARPQPNAPALNPSRPVRARWRTPRVAHSSAFRRRAVGGESSSSWTSTRPGHSNARAWSSARATSAGGSS